MTRTINSFLLLSLSIFIALSDTFIFGCVCKEDASVDDLFNPATQMPVQAPPTPENCLSPQDIIPLITPGDPPPLINTVRILRENLYKRTTGPVTRRSLLDQPSLAPDWLATDCWSWTAQLFYNFTPHVFFTENSPFIRDYIDLTNENIINELTNAIESLEIIKIDIPNVLGLFHTIKLQQHRAGVMFGLSKVFCNWAFNVRIPLYYLLEHFFLTDAEINRIKNSPFIQQLQDTGETPSSCDENEAKAKEFVLQHLVSDRVGLGDTRLNLDLNLYQSTCSQAWLGLRTTLPTAVAFKSGLLGGQFTECADIPPFDIEHLLNLGLCQQNQTNVERNLSLQELQNLATDFLVGALDRLSTNLITTPLGNGRHFGAGPEFTFRYQINNCFSAHFYAAVEAFTKHHERRFFLVQKNQADFNRDYRDLSKAAENLAFLNQQVINTLYPHGVRIEVRPGLIAQTNLSVRYDTEHWHGSLGFDYWRQGPERLGCIIKGNDVPLDIARGKRAAAHQGKVFGSFGYYSLAKEHWFGWHILINADATVFNRGIGENFTAGILLGIDF